ncbi:DUF2213 domain-containing protein [Novosphingobium sp. FSY-8]|uniref:DUF2213 domain-containing protein n=1 Tax=Novosphingobium ovatum TaxID=1908523 RepID=A0ABW9XFT0_9SPHN|nr:DUF2213 domain-containing protein [Novosphingobium ovatum]NBC37354.1 DUF2213 domain-containing protein [Novosphingobium ovatum]
MLFSDTLILDVKRQTAGGYMAVRAKVARTGVYDYLGSEIDPQNAHGLRDRGLVKVLRDESAVFDEAAARSFIGKPITDNHPPVPVTAENWRDHARGVVMGAMRDGQYLAFDLLLTDAAIIREVRGGKGELSNGYAAGIEFGDFTAPDGTKCVARQTTIRGNHVAIVDHGRAGPECRIADHAICDAVTADELNRLKAIFSQDERKPAMASIVVDGLPVSLADENAVRAVFDKKDAALADSAKALTDAKAELAARDGKIAALETQLADAKAATAPAAIDKLVADRSALIAQAKAVVPTIVTDGKTAEEIRRAVVSAKLGDKCPVEDAAVAGAFAVLAADAKPVAQTIVPIGAPAVLTDNATAVAGLRAMRYAR